MSINTEALAEVDEIIKIMPKEDYLKIPNKFKEFIKTYKSQEYKPHIKKDIPLHRQDLMMDTKVMCSLIYRSYLCSKDEKFGLDNKDREILMQREQELREKYNPDNIFKNRQTTVAENTITPNNFERHTEIIEYKEQKWYQKIFARILKIFKR